MLRAKDVEALVSQLDLLAGQQGSDGDGTGAAAASQKEKNKKQQQIVLVAERVSLLGWWLQLLLSSSYCDCMMVGCCICVAVAVSVAVSVAACVHRRGCGLRCTMHLRTVTG